MAAAGITVECETELISFENHTEKITTVISRQGKTETLKAHYLAGYDGAHFTVRKLLMIPFDSGDYTQTFYVADANAQARWPMGKCAVPWTALISLSSSR